MFAAWMRGLRRRHAGGGARRAIISLTFDDGSADHLTVAEQLAERGLLATFYVNSGRVGTSGCLSWENVDAIAAMGHETAVTARTTSTSPKSNRRKHLHRSTTTARRFAPEGPRCLDASSFSYPYGACNAAVKDLVVRAGYSSARCASGLALTGEYPHAESLPPLDRYAIRATPNFIQGTPLERMKSVVERTASRGGWTALVFHRISEGETRDELSPAVFARFIDWLSSPQCRSRVELVRRLAAGES